MIKGRKILPISVKYARKRNLNYAGLYPAEMLQMGPEAQAPDWLIKPGPGSGGGILGVIKVASALSADMPQHEHLQK